VNDIGNIGNGSLLKRLDHAPVDGINGIEGSLAYIVDEISLHNHSQERWVGKKGTQTATSWADDVLTPFRAISGNNTYGADANDEAKVIGIDDTPIISGSKYYNIHSLLIHAVSTSTVWKIRLIYGSGTMAEAIAAGKFSTEMFLFDPVNPQLSAGIPMDISLPKLACGVDKVWVQAWNMTDNATFDFTVGIHEYPN